MFEAKKIVMCECSCHKRFGTVTCSPCCWKKYETKFIERKGKFKVMKRDKLGEFSIYANS